MIRRISGVIEEWDDALPIALPGFNDSRITYQMNDAKLNGGFGINRLNCFRKAFNPSTHGIKRFQGPRLPGFHIFNYSIGHRRNYGQAIVRCRTAQKDGLGSLVSSFP